MLDAGPFRVPLSEQKEQPKSASLWEQGRAYLANHRQELVQERQDQSLGKRYGESVVRSKFQRCYANITACIESYASRRAEANRPFNKKEIQTRIQELLDGKRYQAQREIVKKLTKQVVTQEIRAELGLNVKTDPDLLDRLNQAKTELSRMPLGRDPKNATEEILLEEVTQEYALSALDERVKDKAISPESLNAAILLELKLENAKEPETYTSFEEGFVSIQKELDEFIEQGFINPAEKAIIEEYSLRYAASFGKGMERLHEKNTLHETLSVLRDNARKVAYQTKMDRKTLAGSDHGVRHIYQGNTNFAEQMMAGLEKEKSLDFKKRDEVLIRQIIIDHDLGYTTPAAFTKEGGGAAKDHPCVGCRYIEANKEYYKQKFGQDGYDVTRDVLLNHSYPSSRYEEKRPEPNGNRTVTYNRHLIRSVVSTVDSLGTTSETKAMELFRYPETIQILQDAKLYLESQSENPDSVILERFKEKLKEQVDYLANQGKISATRVEAFYQAIETKFGPDVVKKTLGQYAGMVKSVTLEKRDEQFKPSIRMDVSQLQAMVADLFGEKTSLNGFKKAMEVFGIDEDALKKLGRTIEKLRTETDPKKREKLKKELEFETERAHFKIGDRETTGLKDEREGEHQAITESFKRFQEQTVRTEIMDLFDGLKKEKKPRSETSIAQLQGSLMLALDLEDAQEIKRMVKLMELASKHRDQDAYLEVLQSEVKRFLSKSEKERLKSVL